MGYPVSGPRSLPAGNPGQDRIGILPDRIGYPPPGQDRILPPRNRRTMLAYANCGYAGGLSCFILISVINEMITSLF